MEDEEDVPSRNEEDSSQDSSPSKAYEVYLKNEELVDKLKLLDYEQGYLKMAGPYKPITKHYFVKSTNVGEQFFLFTTLAAWLIKKTGNDSFEIPQEFDDPNMTISRIADEAKNKGISGDYTTAKLKSGSGEPVIDILNSFADEALIHIGFQWKPMIPPSVEDEDVDVDRENDSNGSGDEIDDLTAFDHFDNDHDDDIDDGDEDDVVAIDLGAPTIRTDDDQPIKGVMQSSTNEIEWKEELERVAPLLKITIRQDAKDWRLHLEQMNSMQKNVDEQIIDVEPILEGMSNELSNTIDRITSREKTLNQQLQSMMSKFRSAQERRSELREKYKISSGGVSSRTARLDQISDDIEQLKQQIEEQGARSNDGAPLVKIKQAVNKMEEELQRMNVQIGALEHSILNTYLRDRFQFSTAVNHFDGFIL